MPKARISMSVRIIGAFLAVILAGCGDQEDRRREDDKTHQPVSGAVKIMVSTPIILELVNGEEPVTRLVENKYVQDYELILDKELNTLTLTCRAQYKDGWQHTMKKSQDLIIKGKFGHVYDIWCERESYAGKTWYAARVWDYHEKRELYGNPRQ